MRYTESVYIFQIEFDISNYKLNVLNRLAARIGVWMNEGGYTAQQVA